jgi:DNA-binding NtrC family response regulator
MQLGLGLRLLEDQRDERTPTRLIQLQALADRTGLVHYQDRLRALWPEPRAGSRRSPLELVRDWLVRRARPAWVLCGAQRPLELGTPIPPPETLRSRLRLDGALGPLEVEGRLWWGFPIQWEGAPVGAALIELAAEEPLAAPLELELLAPWLAALAPARVEPFEPQAGEFLTDGSEPMAGLFRELARVAPTELPMLLLGPTGSGKELIAREIHRRSGRAGAFIPVNCSAFAEGVLESELFGHVKGAFTGADRERKGAIETAHGGTLLLDEVADLSPRLQSLFLRVLQEQEVRRVGSDRAHKVDVRFIAATHKPLEDLAAAGGFRKDLWYRLQGTVLRLPSLKDRRHEFPWLLPRVVALLCRRLRREPPELAPGLAQALSRLDWPGNFREFSHALERALLRSSEGVLGVAHFPELDAPALQERGWFDATHEFQRRLLLETLRRHRFKGTEAARTLGLARPALYAAARRLGLDLAKEKERWETEGNRPG